MGNSTSISANDQEKLRQQQKEKRSSGILGGLVKKASSHPNREGGDLRSGGIGKRLQKRSAELGGVQEGARA